MELHQTISVRKSPDDPNPNVRIGQTVDVTLYWFNGQEMIVPITVQVVNSSGDFIGYVSWAEA